MKKRPDTVGDVLRRTARALRRRKPVRRPEGPLNADCLCGSGWSQLGDTVYVTPHAPGCQELAKIVALEKSGICAQCGSRKVSERNGEIIYCPDGCSRSLSGEAFLELMDANGSPWIREMVKADNGQT